MSDSTENQENTPAVGVSVNPYNTYGLATQGFVWAALSSVSADWGHGHVKTVNGIGADLSGNVQVSTISSYDYSGDLNSINSDLSVTIAGEGGHRLLTDVDDSSIRSFVRSISGEFRSDFDSVCALIPSEATSANKLADKAYVDDKIKGDSPAYRGGWPTWSAVPTSVEMYPEDPKGSRTPKNTDYITIVDASELSYRTAVSENLVGSKLAEDVLEFQSGHILTASDIQVIKNAGITDILVYRSGSWRFVYVGTWAERGKSGWNADYELSKISFTDEQWSAINSTITVGKVNALQSASGTWNSAATEIASTSADSRSVYSSVKSASSEWDSAYTEISTTSADNRSVYSSVNTASARWDSAYTEISTTSADNRSVYTTVGSNSGIWETYTSMVAASSPNWNSVYASVKEASARWDETSGSTRDFTIMMATSALTSAKGYADDVAATTLSDANAYSRTMCTSAITEAKRNVDENVVPKLDSVYASVSSTSSDWNRAYSEISETSADIRSVYGTVGTLSGRWDSSSLVTASHSAYWDDTYSTVMTHSADWNATSGSTKAYTDMMATSALTSAKKYADESIYDAYVRLTAYAEFVGTSALTSANSYADTAVSGSEVRSRAYADSTAASALTSAVASSNAYSDYVAASAAETAFAYTDLTSLSLSAGLSAYAEKVGADTLESSNIYSRFCAISALTAANSYTDTAVSGLSGDVTTAATSALTAAMSYTDSVTAQMNKTATYELEWNSPSGISDFARLFANPVNGDLIILRKRMFEGATGVFSTSSYTYYCGTWSVMGGDSKASGTFFTENLTTTTDVGNVKVDPSVGRSVIESAGKNINELFESIFVSEKEPEVKLPGVTSVEMTKIVGTTLPTDSSFETGTTLTLSAHSIGCSDGSYTYGPVSTASVTGFSVSFNGVTNDIVRSSSASIAFDAFTLTDEMSSKSDFRSVAISGRYRGDSVTPVTNLGNAAPSKRISDGMAEFRTSECITSHRKAFCGSSVTNVTESMVDSTMVRSLSKSIPLTSESIYGISSEYPVGAKCVMFAYPKFMGAAERITDSNGFGANVINAFSRYEVEILGNNPSTQYALPYYVYVKNAAEENGTSNSYTLKFKD